jgi:hypothetical protein
MLDDLNWRESENQELHVCVRGAYGGRKKSGNFKLAFRRLGFHLKHAVRRRFQLGLHFKHAVHRRFKLGFQRHLKLAFRFHLFFKLGFQILHLFLAVTSFRPRRGHDLGSNALESVY